MRVGQGVTSGGWHIKVLGGPPVPFPFFPMAILLRVVLCASLGLARLSSRGCRVTVIQDI